MTKLSHVTAVKRKQMFIIRGPLTKLAIHFIPSRKSNFSVPSVFQVVRQHRNLTANFKRNISTRRFLTKRSWTSYVTEPRDILHGRSRIGWHIAMITAHLWDTISGQIWRQRDLLRRSNRPTARMFAVFPLNRQCAISRMKTVICSNVCIAENILST